MGILRAYRKNGFPISHNIYPYAIAIVFGLIWSGINPHYWRMWIMEVIPVILGLTIVGLIHRKYSLSPVLCLLITIFGLFHLYAIHFSHSEVDIGNWIQNVFDLTRNPFDRIVHFLQGMTSAILSRELLIRIMRLEAGKGLYLLVSCCALAFAAFYELLEFGAWKLILLRHSSANVLGAQGDVWDTQWDMLWALVGAIGVQFLFSKVHDRSIHRLKYKR